MKKIIIIICLAMVSIVALSACETTRGVGRDLHNAGKAIDEAISG